MALRSLDLCSGYGGFALGLRGIARPVCYVEREAQAASILAARMEAGDLPPAPVWSDLSTLDGQPWRLRVDLVTAGFPCQPFSLAGKGLADKDERHLWPHVERVLEEVAAPVVLLENVPGLVRRGLAIVLEGLARLGFDAEWDLFTAAADGAPHLRQRWFLLGATQEGQEILRSNADSWRQQEQQERDRRQDSRERPAQQRDYPLRLCPAVADTDSPRREVRQGEPCYHGAERSAPVGGGWWAAEPAVGRVADGAPHRVDRLRALGNGVVPATVRRSFLTLADRMLSWND